MLKQKYFLTDFFILSAEKQPIKLSWRNIEWLQIVGFFGLFVNWELKILLLMLYYFYLCTPNF